MDTTRIESAIQITSLTGQAFVIARDGTVSPVTPGQILPAGSVLLTDENSGIVYSQVSADTTTDQAQSEAPAPEPAEELEAIQAAILAGLDPTELFEATAAGAPAPAAGPATADGSGNAGFVVVGRTGDALLAQAGFDTAFAPEAFATVLDELPRLLDENSIPELEINYNPPLTPSDLPPEFPDLAGGNFAWVDEGALDAGSRAGSDNESASGTLIINTGGDALALVEVQDADGNWIDITNGGTVPTEYGTIVFDENYNWTYSVTDPQTHNDTNAVFDGDRLSEVIPVRITDDDGEQATGNINIEVLDDGPDAVDDVASTPEDTAIVVDVLANDTEGADGATVTGVAFAPGFEEAGTVSLTEDGRVRFEPAPGTEGQVQIEYTLTDSDGDSDTATLTITVGEDSTPTLNITFDDGRDWVAESALDDGSNPGSPTEATSGTLDINTFGDTLASLEVRVQDSSGTWVNVTGGGTVSGRYGTLNVTQNPDGSYQWDYTLNDNTTEHTDPLKVEAADVLSDDFDVRVIDSDGSPVQGTLSVDVRDDGPDAR
ncbi:retention module-containing protein, partial [Oceanimonas smirnovii]|uniref:retention module-containing protein n=1 Tax=Oceanimonas smirnovii TaxID=264574 RepID=UPI003FD4A3DA